MRRRHSCKGRSAALAILFALAAATTAPAQDFLPADLVRAAEEQPLRSRLLCNLEDPRIDESSGLARHSTLPGVFWTINDSGGGARLYAISPTGQTLATVRVTGAVNLDWEDLAAGPGSDGRPALFIGDIGDNFRIRGSLQVYEIPEPDIAHSRPGELLASQRARMWGAHYPGRPQDAESLMIHPQTGRLYLITKNRDGHSVLYAFPERRSADRVMRLEHVASLLLPRLAHPGKNPEDNRLATAGCISPDGRRLVVATYSSLYEWRLPLGRLDAAALAQTPVRIVPPTTSQMEAICYGSDSRTLYFTSENLPAPLWKLERHQNR